MFFSPLPADVPQQIFADVNDILEHKKNADRKQCISDRVAPLSEEYWDTMTVEDMLAIARLNKAVGKEYFVKLLGIEDGNAKMTNAMRLEGISHQHGIDMKRRQVCRAAVAEWRAGTEKSPASKPPQKYKCDCHVCLLYLEANPPQPTKSRAKAKPTPSKQQPSKQQSSKQHPQHSRSSVVGKEGVGEEGSGARFLAYLDTLMSIADAHFMSEMAEDENSLQDEHSASPLLTF